MRLWKVNSFSRARWTLHLTPHWRDNWRRNRSQINRNGIRLLSNHSQFLFALCSEIYSSSPLSSSSASPPDSSCLFAPNSVIIKQSFIVRVCVVINDCFYAEEIPKTENWIRISNGISNSGCSFRYNDNDGHEGTIKENDWMAHESHLKSEINFNEKKGKREWMEIRGHCGWNVLLQRHQSKALRANNVIKYVDAQQQQQLLLQLGW